MGDLEYRLGTIELDFSNQNLHSQLELGNNMPDNYAMYIFIVQKKENYLTIHLGQNEGTLERKLKLNKEELVGGGVVYLTPKKRLVLGGFSIEYFAIPHEIAEAFLKILAEKFKQEKIETKGIEARTTEELLNDFWKKQK